MLSMVNVIGIAVFLHFEMQIRVSGRQNNIVKIEVISQSTTSKQFAASTMWTSEIKTGLSG